MPVVKVARGFWDSHHDNFESHRELVPDFDHVLSVLLDDLQVRGLLESTLVVVLSEFGRTPVINQDVGLRTIRGSLVDGHGGQGVRGGCVYGETDADGKTVKNGELNASDLAATIYQAAGIDLKTEYQAGLRPDHHQRGSRVIKKVCHDLRPESRETAGTLRHLLCPVHHVPRRRPANAIRCRRERSRFTPSISATKTRPA